MSEIQTNPTKNQNENKNPSRTKTINTVIIAVEVFLFFLGVMDISGALNLGVFNGAMFFLFAASVPTALMYFLGKKFGKGVFNFMGVLLIIAAVLEITVFQYPTYSSFFGSSEHFSMPASQAIINGVDVVKNSDGSVTLSGESESALEFTNIKREIDTIKTVLKFTGTTKYVNLTVDAGDETNKGYRGAIGTKRITENDSSHYIRMNLSGKVTNLLLRYKAVFPGDKVVIKRIEFNKPIPFNIMYLRFVLIALLALLSYALFSSKALKKAFEKDSGKFAVAVVALFLVALVFMSSVIVYKLPKGGLGKDFETPDLNQINQEVVDAFENGTVELDAKATEEFKKLKNPYDWSLRLETGELGEWDHVYYEGKYYTYYGVAPVLVLYLPYHMIFGNYFPTDIAVLLFSAIGLAFLCWLYFEFIARFFKRIPLKLALAGFVVMISSCGVFYLTGRTLFYEISISSGFMFTTLGAYLLVTSNIFEDKKINLIKIFFSSLCIGMAVLSRPTLAVYAVCAALFFGWRIVKEFKAKSNSGIPLLIVSALPLVACAVFQMWYNFARFGSFFDFGIEYSVTINDFTRNSFYLIFVVISLFGYLLATPTVSPTYPYVSNEFNRLGANGYYFQDFGSIPGIIFLAFPVLGYLFSGKALRLIPDKKQRRKYLWMIGLPCLIMPLIIICSVWESGYAVRYVADFSWEMLIGALVILYFLYLKSENEQKKKLFEKLMAVSAVVAVIVNGILIFNFTFADNKFPEAAAMLERMISFWR
ncbi:MAG: hypothetical protein IJ932_03760 [Ruminococcus sp.]|nr:hypothetical protein [Ruminococcus sp.]